MDQADPRQTVSFERVIEQRRSLSNRARAVVLGSVTAYAFFAGVAVYSLTGALLPGVLLLVATSGLIAAFGALDRQNPGERVRIVDGRLCIDRRLRGEWRVLWDEPVGFTRVNWSYGCAGRLQLSVTRCGRAVGIGDLLSPMERAQFGLTLQDALIQAPRRSEFDLARNSGESMLKRR